MRWAAGGKSEAEGGLLIAAPEKWLRWVREVLRQRQEGRRWRASRHESRTYDVTLQTPHHAEGRRRAAAQGGSRGRRASQRCGGLTHTRGRKWWWWQREWSWIDEWSLAPWPWGRARWYAQGCCNAQHAQASSTRLEWSARNGGLQLHACTLLRVTDSPFLNASVPPSPPFHYFFLFLFFFFFAHVLFFSLPCYLSVGFVPDEPRDVTQVDTGDFVKVKQILDESVVKAVRVARVEAMKLLGPHNV